MEMVRRGPLNLQQALESPKSNNPSRPANLRSMEGFKAVDSLRRLGFEVPFEEPQPDTIRQKISNREAMLLDGLNLFPHIEVLGRRSAHAAKGRRPRARRRAYGACQYCS